MDKIKALIREPALLLDAFETFVVMAIALGLFSLSGDQQTNLVALFIALLGVAKGFLTQPFPVTVITDFGRAAIVFSVSLGLLKWSPDQVTVVVTFLGTLMTLVQRSQITPRYDPVIASGGAGAGPVADANITRGEQGATDLLTAIGAVLLVVGLLNLLLMLVGSAFLPLVISLILIVVGALMFAFGRRSVL